MHNRIKTAMGARGLTDLELAEELKASLTDINRAYKKALLIPPDHTRVHSGAGGITNIYYQLLKDTCEVYVLPALGTHVAMTQDECARMFGDIPYERFIVHNWREDVVKLGEVPEDFVTDISEGALCQPVDININKHLVDPSYDLILSIGQVVPHEVVGMANYTKNLLVGCGGSAIINASHIMGALYGMERLMGKDFSPVRKLFDYAEEHFLQELPLYYVLTVTTAYMDEVFIHGLYIGRSRSLFEQAVALSQQKNLVFTDTPFEKVVVYLDPEEFKSTWLGNKAIYRTRMAIADGGELLILAPGVQRFGEDADIDKLIRSYGYTGRKNIIAKCEASDDLQKNISAAAHLIHGSSDGRFGVTYCTNHLTQEEIEGAGFKYMSYDEASGIYDPTNLKEGFNTMPDGERIFFISNPALGLWVDRSKF